MARFAVIEEGVVTNVVMADSKESAELVTGSDCVESDIANIGDPYVNGNFVITTPEETEEEYTPGRLVRGIGLTPEEQELRDSLIAGASESGREEK
jgi:hypothetical protein